MPEIHNPADRRAPDVRSADPETREVVHELVNVLAAIRVEIFVADRAREGTRPAEKAPRLRSPRGTDHETPHNPRSQAELLGRLDLLTDRAIELTEILGHRVRRVPWDE